MIMIWTDRFSQKLINVIRVRSVQIHKYGVYDYIYYSCVGSGTTCTAAGWGLISERGVASEELKEVKTI